MRLADGYYAQDEFTPRFLDKNSSDLGYRTTLQLPYIPVHFSTIVASKVGYLLSDTIRKQPRRVIAGNNTSAIVVLVSTTLLLFFPIIAPPSAEATSTSYVLMEAINNTTGMSLEKSRQAHVEYVGPDSQLISKMLDSVTIQLKKKGNPTGTAEVGVIDGNSLQMKKVFGTIDAASLTNSYKEYIFALGNYDKAYKLQSSDGIGIKYNGGNNGNNISVMRDTTAPFDGQNTYHRYYTNSWADQKNVDMWMKLTFTPPKYAILHFDDGFKSQYNYAVPALNQYDIDASFFIVCGSASGSLPGYMRWNEIDQLQPQGHSIQNHGMTHAHLPAMTDAQIDAEIGDCKNILVNQHGSSGVFYALPFNDGATDERIVTKISQYHSFGKGAGGTPQLANCGGNCEIRNSDGTYNPKNRYTMMQWSHDTYSAGKTEGQILDGFKATVNGVDVDVYGNIVKMPIITYHRINEGGASPSQSLFGSEMQYLHDNGFWSLTMDDLQYDSTAKKFVLKELG